MKNFEQKIEFNDLEITIPKKDFISLDNTPKQNCILVWHLKKLNISLILVSLENTITIYLKDQKVCQLITYGSISSLSLGKLGPSNIVKINRNVFVQFLFKE